MPRLASPVVVEFHDDHRAQLNSDISSGILFVGLRADNPHKIFFPGYEGGRFCVNPLYRGDKGEVRLSRWSVAGVISPKEMDRLVSGEVRWVAQGDWLFFLANNPATPEQIGRAHDKFMDHHHGRGVSDDLPLLIGLERR